MVAICTSLIEQFHQRLWYLQEQQKKEEEERKRREQEAAEEAAQKEAEERTAAAEAEAEAARKAAEQKVAEERARIEEQKSKELAEIQVRQLALMSGWDNNRRFYFRATKLPFKIRAFCTEGGFVEVNMDLATCACHLDPYKTCGTPTLADP